MNWYWILGWIPSTLAIFGNGFVIYLIYTRRRLHTIANGFILSLALADLGVGACYFPANFICEFSPRACLQSVADDIAVAMIYSSTSCLCVMAIDRYLAIVRPLSYMTLMTRKRAFCLMTLSWLIPFTTYFIPGLCTSLHRCSINRNITVVIWTTMFEFIPCAVLLFITVKIISIARDHRQQTTRLDTQLRFNEPKDKSYKIHTWTPARVIITVVAIFLVCYSLEVCSSLCYFTDLCTFSDDLFNAVRFLVVTNSAGNPIAYALLKRDIKRELKEVLWEKNDANVVATKV